MPHKLMEVGRLVDLGWRAGITLEALEQAARDESVHSYVRAYAQWLSGSESAGHRIRVGD